MRHYCSTFRAALVTLPLFVLVGCTAVTEPGPARTPILPAITATAIPTIPPTPPASPTRQVLESPMPATPADGRWQPPEPQKDAPLSPVFDSATSLLSWFELVGRKGDLSMKITRDGQLFVDEQRNPLLNHTVTVTVYQNGQPVQTLEASSGAQVPAEFQALLDWLALIYDDYAGSPP